MKRFLCLFAALALLSAVALVAAFSAVNGAKEEVVLTEEVLYGEAAAVADLTVTLPTHYDHRLFWNMVFKPGKAEFAQTEFSFYATGKHETSEWTRELNIQTISNGGIRGNNIDLSDEERYGYDRPIKAIQAVADRTAAGETREERLRLRDYYETYPLNVWLNGAFYLEEERELSGVMSEYCAIPVPEEQMIQVTVSKDELGGIYEIDCYEETGGLNLSCLSIFNEYRLYFTLNIENMDGSAMALPEHLQGIHRMDFDEAERGGLELRPNSLQRVYPPDADAGRITQLMETKDGMRLMIITKNEAGATLSVLDKTTMKCLQTIPLSQEGDWVACLRREEGFWVAFFSNGTFDLVTEEKGTFSVALTGNFYERTGLEWLRFQELGLSYDGSRFAAGAVGYRPADGMPYESCAATVMVFDPTGLLYAGRYHSSVDRAYQRDSGETRSLGTVAPVNETGILLSF